MLPDKIYVREYPDGIARFWESKKKEDVAATIPHEYIRKEALMEWAKECFRLQDKGSWYSKGAADAFSEVINKLNEM